MTQGMVVTLVALVIVLSLGVAVVAWLSSRRWIREYRETAERTAAARDEVIQAREAQLQDKDETLATLREEVDLLRGMESVRFAERYLETKAGLEERLHRLETRRDRWKARLEDEERKKGELELSSEQKAEEIERLRSELTKVQLDTRTLEEALQSVSSLGEIPVEDLRSALGRRRRRQVEITSRLDQLGLEGEGKDREAERIQAEIERARKEVELVEREIEITRAAGPILDSLLGVTADMKERLGAVEERLDASMRSLSRAPGRDPIAEFLDAAAGASRERKLLLAAGAGGPQSHELGADAGPEPRQNGEEPTEPEGSAQEGGADPQGPEEEAEARVVREPLASSGRRPAASQPDSDRREE